MGVVNALLVLVLGDACELQATTEETYAQVPQDENVDTETAPAAINAPLEEVMNQPESTWKAKIQSWFVSRFTEISAPTRSIMYKLWFLLIADSLADGMVPYSLTNYYIDIRFHVSKSTLGDVTSVSYLLGAIGAVFAGPLARKIGLINTMVFTHVPSSAAVLLFPFPPVFWMTASLLLLRTALNNMDQAPRSAFIAGVVKPEERTAVMGITSMLRTLAAMAGPTLTGVLASNKQFWIAFVAAGVCRLAYDFGLYALFINTKLYQHESSKPNGDLPNGEGDQRRRRERDEEMLELQSLADSEGSAADRGDDSGDDRSEMVSSSKQGYKNGGLQLPAANDRVRSRSPHRSTVMDEAP